MSELTKSASRALSGLYAKFKCAEGMSNDAYTNLYTSLVEPILYYCSGIWGLTGSIKVNTVQNKACRYFLGVGKNAANLTTRGDMGWTDCLVNQRLETCRFFCKLTNIENVRLVKQIFMWPNLMVNAGRKGSSSLFIGSGYHIYLRKILFVLQIQLRYVKQN